MVTHMVMDEFLLHATTFGLGVYIIATRVLKVIPQQVKNPVTKKKFQNIATLGLDIRWHVLTAIGGYTAVAVIDVVTTGEVTDDPTDTFAWPVPLAIKLMSGKSSSVKKE
ncbi:hypothetical protein ACHAP8_004000 [Fusarium lateritium]